MCHERKLVVVVSHINRGGFNLCRVTTEGHLLVDLVVLVFPDIAWRTFRGRRSAGRTWNGLCFVEGLWKNDGKCPIRTHGWLRSRRVED